MTNQASSTALQIGVSRPPLPLADLPTPEEVFSRPRIGLRELVTCVLGPSMIALGVSIGSGEWLLGPLAFGKYGGFIGLGWLITISAILQTFYNVENARYTLATGEVPVVGFSRTPPGYMLWVPATLLVIYIGWVWGGWASSAGQSIFALCTGRTFRTDSAAELETVRVIAIGLMFLSLLVYLVGKKIARTLEIIDTFLLFIILSTLIILAALFAPPQLWREMLAGIVTPAPLPKGIDAQTLGSIIGYTGFGAGMNFMLINYYRDHGYAMGHKVGFFSGLFGGQKQEVLPSGVTFRETPDNARIWNRWFRYLLIDQWLVFFVGAIIGMFVPSILVVALSSRRESSRGTRERTTRPAGGQPRRNSRQAPATAGRRSTGSNTLRSPGCRSGRGAVGASRAATATPTTGRARARPRRRPWPIRRPACSRSCRPARSRMC